MLQSLHKAVFLLLIKDKSAFDTLTAIIDKGVGNWSNALINFLIVFKNNSKPFFQLRLVEALAPILSGELFVDLLKEVFLIQRNLYPEKGFQFNINRTNDEHYRSLITYLKYAKENFDGKDYDINEFIKTLLLIIAEFGTVHPSRFVWSRSELISWQLSKTTESIYSTSQKAYYNLVKGFRLWVGKTTLLTVDPESGEEYGWEDVITFDDNMRVNHKKLLIDAISNTSLIRESIFLFSKKYIINLNDIPQKGIWISCLTNNKSKAYLGC